MHRITIALTALSLTALAQDPPSAPREPLPREDNRPRPQFEPQEPGRFPERKPREILTPFLGIISRPAAPEVRSQLKLGVGFGLVIAEVIPDSPAAAAGLRESDILVRFNDQRLVSSEQLQFLILDAGKDKDVSLTFYREGAQQSVTVKVAEKMMPERRPMANFQGGDQPRQPIYNDRQSERPMRDPSFQPGEPRPPGEQRIMRRDAKGRYELTLGAEPTFHAMDPDGKTIWKGPIAKPEQRKEIPQEIRQILETMEREIPNRRPRNPQPFDQERD